MRLLKFCFVVVLLCLIWDAESVYASEDEYQEVDISNTSVFTVLIPKEIKMVGSSGVANYSIGVKGQVSLTDKVVIKPSSKIIMTCATKPNVTVSITQEKTEWIKEDVNTEEYNVTRGTLLVETVYSGSYKGSIIFSISVEPLYRDGAYDAEGNLVCTWDELGVDIERDYTEDEIGVVESSPLYVLMTKYPTVTKIKIPDSIMRIGNGAFGLCSSLEEIQLSCNLQYIGISSFVSCQSLRVLNLPEGVETICFGAFAGCSSLESLVIPVSVTDIGEAIIVGCTKLSELRVAESNSVFTSRDNQGIECNVIVNMNTQTLVVGSANSRVPEGVTTIGEYAFSGQLDLTELELPGGVEVIEDYAFAGTGLTFISISDTVVKIGKCAFQQCTSLKSIAIPESVINIGTRVFYECTSLQSATLSVTIQGITEAMFYGCSSLQEVIIPNDVTIIEVAAFENCTSLESITLPEKLRTIGTVFRGCTSLREVVYKGVAYTNNSELKKALEAAGLVVDYVIWSK